MIDNSIIRFPVPMQTHVQCILKLSNVMQLTQLSDTNVNCSTVTVMCGDVGYIITDVCVTATVEWQIKPLLLQLQLKTNFVISILC